MDANEANGSRTGTNREGRPILSTRMGSHGRERWLEPDAYADYRQTACRRFVRRAEASGYRGVYDLRELAQDLYADFWVAWLKRSHGRELSGEPVPYIVAAMMYMLHSFRSRGRSVRESQLVHSEHEPVLAMIAATDLEPAEQVIQSEELWCVSDIVRSLPIRERVVVAAILGRDSKRKHAPPAGYRLAASQLRVSEVRAKKLSHSANQRIRSAAEQLESGTWCARWEDSIKLVAAGKRGDAEFLHHAKHCAQCRLSVVRLRTETTDLQRARSHRAA
jgi:DNA-directed RNA polymerase specialized sigma24 family protein